ncbi:hypothetical protein NQ315_014557 [Exocentrus adspersus]|uniref:Uncharacterized protein n=1 Tax=Exocentrus adspersus TaxID=1586481 RepID=A0AAV8VLJ1_9CUCU|nr:hypothetical protein NQ315_014557 [Exocentrus adspersus]
MDQQRFTKFQMKNLSVILTREPVEFWCKEKKNCAKRIVCVLNIINELILLVDILQFQLQSVKKYTLLVMLISIEPVELWCKQRQKILGEETVPHTFSEVSEHNRRTDSCRGCSSIPTSSKKIHVISDINLDTSDSSLSYDFDFLVPDANSTVLQTQDKVKNGNPWRFTEYLRRNPYYLHIKNGGLPSLQQDLIIDYTQLQRLTKYFRNTKRLDHRPNKFSSAKELGSSCERNKEESVIQSSIFDIDDFIPDHTKAKENNIVNKQTVNHRGAVLQDVTNNCNIYAPRIYKKRKLLTSDNGGLVCDKLRKESAKSNHKLRKESNSTEDRELEQWAAKFNSMCQDIENHKLEIE